MFAGDDFKISAKASSTLGKPADSVRSDTALVWDLTHKICGERADHEFARVAVNAYLRSVSAETPDEQIPRFSSAFRAWTLAAQVGDRAGINAAKSMVMRLHRE